MAYSYLKLGARGEDVKTLQQMLLSGGYDIDVDGVFGEKTQDAVKAYQAANALNADGAADDATWAKLSASFKRPDAGYAPAQLSTAGKVNYLEQNRPAAYVSGYAQQIDDLLGKVMNREAFKYDPVNDEMYRRYRDQYTYQGERAMNNALGAASTLSGGYLNSYAAGAGNQMYQDYMARLSGEIPALYKLALSAYDAEGERLTGALDALTDADNQAYKRYLEDTDAYNDALDYYYKKLKDEIAQASKKSSGGTASASKTTPATDTTKASAIDNKPAVKLPALKPTPKLLTEYEFKRKKLANTASLKPYANYAAYVSAMQNSQH